MYAAALHHEDMQYMNEFVSSVLVMSLSKLTNDQGTYVMTAETSRSEFWGRGFELIASDIDHHQWSFSRTLHFIHFLMSESDLC